MSHKTVITVQDNKLSDICCAAPYIFEATYHFILGIACLIPSNGSHSLSCEPLLIILHGHRKYNLWLIYSTLHHGLRYVLHACSFV